MATYAEVKARLEERRQAREAAIRADLEARGVKTFYCQGCDGVREDVGETACEDCVDAYEEHGRR